MFKTDGGIQVYFKHYEDEVGIEPSGMPYRGRTLCVIEQNGECLRDGEAFCGINEKRFDKATGRKTALTRALEGAPKEFRTKIWTEYISKSKKQ